MIPPEVPPDNSSTRYLSLPSESAPSTPSATGPLDLQRPWVIEFRVVGTASTIKVRVADTMVIGRSDAASGFTPDVDLTAFDALGKGVSRKHAQITIKEQRLMVSDLHSTNGTRLNNALCAPGEEYRLRHGNELMLGTLRLQVSFAVVPAFTDTQHGKTLKEAVAPLIHSIGKRILVIESDPDVGKDFRASLEAVGYKVTLVADVIKGFGVIFKGMPDVIVIDIMETDTNGLDLIRFVRKQKTPQHVPILAVSGALAGYQMNQALSAGADSFLGKPVSVEALLQAVANACKAPAPRLPELMGLPTAPPVPAVPAAEAPKTVTSALEQTPKPAVVPAPSEPKLSAAPGQNPSKSAPAPVQEAPKPAAAPLVPATPRPAASSKPAPVPAKPEPVTALPQVPAKPVEKLVKAEPALPQAKETVKPVTPSYKAEPPAPTSAPRPQIKPINPLT